MIVASAEARTGTENAEGETGSEAANRIEKKGREANGTKTDDARDLAPSLRM